HEQRQADIEASEVQFAEECADFEKQIGIQVEDGDQTWVRLIVQKIHAWQQAAGRHRADQETANASEDALSNARKHCLGLLKAAGVNLPDQPKLTPSLAARQLKNLQEKYTEWKSLSEQLDGLETKTEDLTENRDVVKAGLKAVWERMHLPEGDKLGRAQKIKLWKDFDGSGNELTAAKLHLEETKRRLGAAERLLDLSLAVIESELKEEGNLKEESESLRGQIADIAADLRQAMEGHDVSEKLELLAEANAQLLRQEERNADLAAGNALLGWLRNQVRATLAPRVLTRAKDLVTRFTQGQLTFEVQECEGRPRILAATAHEAWRQVTELSSGERVQLLMAVRLAFLEENEERALPLLLDEILASSDDDRIEQIIRTVVEIARTGRQIFYFTAQADEVEKWTAALAGAGIESRVIDLRKVRGMAECAARPFPPAPPQPRSLPDPATFSHRDYGKLLQVPGVDPRDESQNGLHVWHVIEDTRILHRVLESGIERLGPLERLVRNSRFDKLGDARDAVMALGIAFRAACQAWCVGRSRQVDRAVLEKADGVSANFLDRVVALASEVRGDARQLIGLLESGQLRGWREKSSAEL
ncbi:MAG: hypothetical protein WCH40_13530, partial [Verrucomicrobiales bacterium]